MPRRSRGRTITFDGPAAKAFFLQLTGRPPTTEEEAYQSIATRIHAEMVDKNLTGAVALLKHMTKHGVMKTAEVLAAAYAREKPDETVPPMQG